jgi:Fur family ferric uptake transcriptional regulator
MTRSSNPLHDQVAARLRDHGLVYTAGRRQLVEILMKHKRPASVPELLKLRAKLTQSSMYRNLADLEHVGIIQRVAGVNEHARYELNESFIGHHHHLICVKCGTIDDFVVTPSTERAIDDALSKAAKTARFAISGHRLDAIGLCSSCER